MIDLWFINKTVHFSLFRFVPDKEFSGTDRSGAGRSGPVQFEREEDPFGLDQFLSQAKRASKRKEPERRDERDKKRKRD